MLIKIDNAGDKTIAGVVPKSGKLPSEINFNSQTDKVQDEPIGYLIHNGTNWSFVSCCTHERTSKTNKKIALILESPHKDEYKFDGKNYVPLGPAKGKTGVNIKSSITKRCLKWNLDKNNDYMVILINAVQFQASCWNILKQNSIKLQCNKRFPNNSIVALKQQVFKCLFEYLETDFQARLERYSPDLVVNACTGTDKDTINLKKIVEESIMNSSLNNEEYYFKEPHPSSYWWCK